MTQAKKGDTVKVHYTGKLQDGSIFDASTNGPPIQFTIGEGQLIPGFEKALLGMNPGESKTIKISAEEAYGPHREELVVIVDRKELPPHLTPKVGQRLQINQPENQSIVVTVTDTSESSVTLDANHPLAGKDLTFDIELIEIIS